MVKPAKSRHYFFLQETYWSTELETVIRHEWKGECLFNHGTNHSKGVAIMIKNKLCAGKISNQKDENGEIVNFEILNTPSKKGGRIKALRFEYRKKKYILFKCLYTN